MLLNEFRNSLLRLFIKFMLLIAMIGLIAPPVYADSSMLSLQQAERIAVDHSTELRQRQALTTALEQKSIAEGQLPDPQLSMGTINVPVNNFSFREDEMTMVEVGVSQAIPAGSSLNYLKNQTQALSGAEHQRSKAEMNLVKKNVRFAWLELYYWQHAIQKTIAAKNLLRELSKAVKAQYATGKIEQPALIQSELDISTMNDRLLTMEQQKLVAQAELERWIGGAALNPLSSNLPHWPIPAYAQLKENLTHHPLLRSDAELVRAARWQVNVAHEQHKPKFDVGFSYGFRFNANNPNDVQNGMSNNRPDMVTARVGMSLPIFPQNRQSRRSKSSIKELEAAQLNLQTNYRNLLRDLNSTYQSWLQIKKREQLYRTHLIPEVRQNKKATLLAYQNNKTEFATLMRSYTQTIEIELQWLRLQIDGAKLEAQLLYLTEQTS